MEFEYKETDNIKSYTFHNLLKEDRVKVFEILNTDNRMYPHYLYNNVVFYFGGFTDLNFLVPLDENSWHDLVKASNKGA